MDDSNVKDDAIAQLMEKSNPAEYERIIKTYHSKDMLSPEMTLILNQLRNDGM